MDNTFFIDFETTGLNPFHDEIIEFAIKKYNNQSCASSLVKPNHVFMIPPKITEITGITTQMIFEGSDVISSINATEMIFTFLNQLFRSFNQYFVNNRLHLFNNITGIIPDNAVNISILC